MEILMSIRKYWIDLIFAGYKNLEFRPRIGKDWKENQIIYLYESGPKASKKVVGQAKIKSITKIEHKKCDTVLFVDYYLKNILKNEYYLKLWQATNSIELKDYNDFIKLSNMLCPEYIELLSQGRQKEFVYTIENIKKKDLSDKISTEIDNWLYNIGYYNAAGETNYNYIIELCEIEKYEKPLPLNNFKCNEKIIERAPQSWCYCKKC